MELEKLRRWVCSYSIIPDHSDSQVYKKKKKKNGVSKYLTIDDTVAGKPAISPHNPCPYYDE